MFFLSQHFKTKVFPILAILGFGVPFAILLAYTTALTVEISGNMVLTSSTSGQVELPSGSTAVQLSGTAVLDVSSKMTSAASGNIVIGGVEKTLSNFTSGNLSGVNLSLLQIVGDYAITVAKAVRLLSGVADQPFTLTNTGVSSITVTLPDAVSVLAPSGWNGTIAPPQTVSASGVAPPGFSLGSTAVEVGSSASILLFDKPVALVLSGVTGSVGYKPAGSSNWTQITNTCGGSYASPSAPSFPGECSVSNGSDTKIYTYHFTTFGSLNAVSASSPTPVSSGGNNGGGGGGGSGGIIATVTSVNFSGRAYPKSTVTLLKDAQIAGTTIAGTDANFQISISSLSSGNYIFSLYGEDSKGVRSSLLTFPTSVTSGVTTYVSGIFIAPTIAVDKSEVKRGDNIAIFGQSVPNGDITIGVNSDEEFFNKTKAGQNGAYLLYFDTSPLAVEQHFVRSKAASNDAVSSFSKSISFVVGTKNIAANAPKTVEKGDINGDKRVNLVDFSIVAYWYKRPSPPASSDLNGDGKVNLIDFSIMAFYWTG